VFQDNDLVMFGGGEVIRPLSAMLMAIKEAIKDRTDVPKDEATRFQVEGGVIMSVIKSQATAPHPYENGDYAFVLNLDTGDTYFVERGKLQPL